MPTASVQAHVFAPLAKASAYEQGVPGLRFVFVPQPVMGKSPAELRAYVDGDDPISGRPVMQEIVDALTRPVEPGEARRVSFDRSTPRYVEPNTEENLHRLFLENQWTDRLPIVLPTEGRVEAMLAATSRQREDVVGRLRPTSTREAWAYTVEKVAVNAVMAGARPAYFPVILALAASKVTARPSTSSSGATMVVVNGPVRQEIGMNWGIGAMGPYNHANATIGRAYGLLSQNLQGGSVPELTYLGSQGNNYGYNSVTFAEHEEASPWEPFHVQHGFEAGESTVSLFSGCRSTAYHLGLRQTHWEAHVTHMLRGMNPHVPPTFVLDPIAARLFVDRGGFDTKAKLIEWAWRRATLPAAVYWDDQLVQNYTLPRALQGEEPYAGMLKAEEDEEVPMFRREDIQVVVVGGETNGYWRIMGCKYTKTVPVDAWR